MCDCGCYRLKTASPQQDYQSVSQLKYSALNKGLVEYTTSHGIPHIATASGPCKRVFWFILTVGMVFLWIGNTYLILKEYIQYDVDLNIEFKSSRYLQFPAVTICNQNVLRKTAVETDAALNSSFSTSRGETRYYPGASGSNQQQGLGNSLDKQHENALSLQEILSDYSSKQKEPWGHQYSNFILTCDFAGFECDPASFNTFYNWMYGNCFTFNSGSDFSVENLNATQSGPQGGLQITLNIEQNEYLSDITYKAGARVLVHHQTQFPFPDKVGFDVSPGKATAVGIRKVEIERQGGRYGNCVDISKDNSDINVYEELYTWTNYSQKACENTCYQKELISNCSCFDVSFPSTGSAFSDQAAPACKSTNENQANCVYDAEDRYKEGTVKCDCDEPCKEVLYHVSTSSSDWPSLNYKETLKDYLFNISTAANNVILGDTMSQNFAFLEIYFEELNYELMKEDPSYEDSQFVADFGGAIGLWVGASMITIFEFGEYFLDMMILCCVKSCRKKSNSQANKVNVTTSEKTTIHNRPRNNMGRFNREKPNNMYHN